MARFNNVIVDVPKEAKVAAGRVYIITESRYFSERQYNMDSRLTIGWVNDTSKKTMNPNSNYVARYPHEFSIAARGKLAPVTKRCGMYAFSLALSCGNGMYPALVECCGPEIANAVMDFANYSILYRTNVAQGYTAVMSDQLLYSEKLHSDTWLSELFNRRLTESQQEDFKDKWARACCERGVTNVWLCIDGSNSDCVSRKVELAEKGKAKSHKNINVVSYMYAVDAETGIPITERVYRGGRVDSKAFVEIQAFLKRYAIKVDGVILDRGFCDIGCLETILDQKMHYVIMLKENTSGFHTMYERHAGEIRMKSEKSVGGGIYATTDVCRIFGKYNHDSHITLAYDSKNGTERANHLMDKVRAAVLAANEALASGKKVKIEGGIRTYIITLKEGERVTGYGINHDALQAAMDQKGFSAIATDLDCGAAGTLEKYDLRDKSEKQYMVLKTQLGGRVYRTHYDEGVKAKGFVAFIASIIRHAFGEACREAGYDLCFALRCLNFLCIQRAPDNTYMGVHNADSKQEALMDAAHVEADDIDYYAKEETRRINGEIHDQVHKVPPRSEVGGDGAARRGPGRPRGTAKKEADENPSKRGPGRPPGSKNKPKELGKEKTEKKNPAETEQPPKGKPGRPKGSKNKKPAINAKAKRAAAKAVAEEKAPQ